MVAEPAPWRILIVDPDQLVRDTLPASLARRMDVRVDAVASGQEGLRKLAGEPYRIVLAESALPDLDGLAFLQEVRALHPEVARVLLTSRRDALALARPPEAVHAVVTKPYSLRRLHALVRGLLAPPRT